LKKLFQSRSEDVDGDGAVVVCVPVVEVWDGSEAVGDAVEAWRQREGVKKEVGDDVGVLDWSGGR